MKKKQSISFSLLLIVAFFCFLSCAESRLAGGQNLSTLRVEELKTGDLLFVVNPAGNAITEVTQGYHGLQIDHVGIVIRQGNRLDVVEATTPQGVTTTPIFDFMHPQNDHRLQQTYILAGRLKKKFSEETLRSRLHRYLGKPYDYLFMPDDSAFYCSELVQKSFVTSHGKHIFPTIPMSFHDTTGRITDYWKAFYRKHGKEVPEGAPGTNPGQLSRHKRVKILGKLK